MLCESNQRIRTQKPCIMTSANSGAFIQHITPLVLESIVFLRVKKQNNFSQCFANKNFF